MWIVTGAKGDQISLVSGKDSEEILPIGSYLTVKGSDGVNHILRVEKSEQVSLFEPSPLIVDTDLPIMTQDQECKNVVLATRIRQSEAPNGRYVFIKPQEKAIKSTQEEIDEIFTAKNGFPVFLATHFLSQDKPLRDESNKSIYVKVPFDSLYLQTMICGQTGSGKTVAMKYLIEQFLQNEKGAVLAINVKGDDLLTMDQPTVFVQKPNLKEQSEEEWKTLGLSSPEMNKFAIYAPASKEKPKNTVNQENVHLITLKTADLEPNSLLAILETGSHVTERAAESLPDIFRAWKENVNGEIKTFRNFINYFKTFGNKDHNFTFPTLKPSGEEGDAPLHQGTIRAILQSLESVSNFFDSKENKSWAISETNILIPGKLSVIDLSSKDTTIFGAVLLRHLLSKIYEAKTSRTEYNDVPVLIIIDEVHQFYRSGASTQALEELNAIARMGRSSRIGVVFASQTPEDLPTGLTAIVNTRIFFRSLGATGRKFDVKNLSVELSSLSDGYAAMSSVALPQVRFVKFPISQMGVRT
jgi:DNA helicase HerA-like ATPase